MSITGSLPLLVANLWDELSHAGLLSSLEALFELELLDDELYTDPMAGLIPGGGCL
jgi:hypothetical protein